MAKSQKKRDIPAGATAVATNRVARRDFDMLTLLAARGDDCDVRMED